MNTEWTREEISEFVKKDLLLERLDLASTGTTLADIADDTPLLHEGLAIDSVDALDLLVEVEKTFYLSLPDMSQAFIERTCKNVQTLVDFIAAGLEESKRAAVP